MGKPWTTEELGTEIELSEKEIFKQARAEVLAFIRERGDEMTFIGTISRSLPYYRAVLIDVLADLRSAGLVSFDEHKPAPTRVILAGAKKPQSDVYSGVSWTNVPVVKNGERVKPERFRARSTPAS
jgi:hypothetical protein